MKIAGKMVDHGSEYVGPLHGEPLRAMSISQSGNMEAYTVTASFGPSGESEKTIFADLPSVINWANDYFMSESPFLDFGGPEKA